LRIRESVIGDRGSRAERRRESEIESRAGKKAEDREQPVEKNPTPYSLLPIKHTARPRYSS